MGRGSVQGVCTHHAGAENIGPPAALLPVAPACAGRELSYGIASIPALKSAIVGLLPTTGSTR
jgi:hypothetical protein